jgi:hypothetical protein
VLLLWQSAHSLCPAGGHCCCCCLLSASVRLLPHPRPQFEESTTGDRLHGVLGGRYISVIRHEGSLFAIDSVCFHGRPPLFALHCTP